MTANSAKGSILDFLKKVRDSQEPLWGGRWQLGINGIKEIIEKLEELEAIKSVDYNNTIKMLKGMRLITLDPLEATNEKEREELLYARKKADKTNAKLETAINALHKAQAQEQELEKSDEDKEQSSIDYYNEMKKYKKELEELKKENNQLKIKISMLNYAVNELYEKLGDKDE
jgi:chromosome segregation ATPase